MDTQQQQQQPEIRSEIPKSGNDTTVTDVVFDITKDASKQSASDFKVSQTGGTKSIVFDNIQKFTANKIDSPLAQGIVEVEMEPSISMLIQEPNRKSLFNDPSPEPKTNVTPKKKEYKKMVKKFAIAWDAPQTLNLASAMQINVNVKVTGQQIKSSSSDKQYRPIIPTTQSFSRTIMRSVNKPLAPSRSHTQTRSNYSSNSYKCARTSMLQKQDVISLISDDEEEEQQQSVKTVHQKAIAFSQAITAPQLRPIKLAPCQNKFADKSSFKNYRKIVIQNHKEVTTATNASESKFSHYVNHGSASLRSQGAPQSSKTHTQVTPIERTKQLRPRKSWLAPGAYREAAIDDDDSAVMTAPLTARRKRQRRPSGDDDYRVESDDEDVLKIDTRGCSAVEGESGYSVSGVNVMVTPIFTHHSRYSPAIKQETHAHNSSVPHSKRTRVLGDTIILDEEEDGDNSADITGCTEVEGVPQPVMIVQQIAGQFDPSVVETDTFQAIEIPGTEPFTHVSEEQSFTHVTEEQPFTNVTDEQPFTHITDEQPFTNVTDEQPFTHVTDEQPFTHVTEEQPFTNVTEEQPFTHVTEEQPFTHVTDEQLSAYLTTKQSHALVIDSRHHFTESPHHATESLHHFTESPHHATESLHHFTESPHHSTESLHHITPESSQYSSLTAIEPTNLFINTTIEKSESEKDNYLTQVMEELFPPDHELRESVFPKATHQ